MEIRKSLKAQLFFDKLFYYHIDTLNKNEFHLYCRISDITGSILPVAPVKVLILDKVVERFYNY